MTRSEKIAELERRMTDDQLDDALAMLRSAAAPSSVFETLTPEARARILKIKADAEKGLGVQSADSAFAQRAQKFKARGP